HPECDRARLYAKLMSLLLGAPCLAVGMIDPVGWTGIMDDAGHPVLRSCAKGALQEDFNVTFKELLSALIEQPPRKAS
ncbi:MAG: hypothetical protein EBR10_11110, partial [Planctomycetes bacterium]|nr:hypothetical protein [Planctomycetota bacterium]